MKKIKNHKDFLFVLPILLLASLLRLYRIGDFMTFLGDEGRDVLVVKHILEGDLTLLGPRASAGDFFLGPIYYYFMAPFLWLWRLDPVGPAIMVALLGVCTVYLVYKMGDKFFNRNTGLIAALLYAISPLVIVYSRASWNPNVMPFFTLLTLFILYYAVIQNRKLLFLIVGGLLGIIMQLHYLGTFVALIIAIFVAVGSVVHAKKFHIQLLVHMCIRYLLIFVGFIIGFSPFLLFELRNGFPNTKNILTFIFNPDRTQQLDAKFQDIVVDVFIRLFGRLLVNLPEPRHYDLFDPQLLLVWKVGIIVLALVSVFFVIKMKDKVKKSLLLIWLFVGILAFGFYKKPIYDYYFGLLFPVPFLFVSNSLVTMFTHKSSKLLGKIIVAVVFVAILIPNIYFTPIRYEPNRQKQQMQTIAEFVLSHTDGKPFNFALITPGNSDHAYRYFFELNNRAPVTIENEVVDPERKSVTSQLLIVCEEQCSPLGHPLWEVAGFGRAKIAGEWDVSVVKVYKLVHDTSQKTN